MRHVIQHTIASGTGQGEDCTECAVCSPSTILPICQLGKFFHIRPQGRSATALKHTAVTHAAKIKPTACCAALHRYVLEDAGPDALVLVDELGKGTEVISGHLLRGLLHGVCSAGPTQVHAVTLNRTVKAM